MAFRKIAFSKIDRPADLKAGSAPILQWIEVDKLVVDESYQRELKAQNWKAIRNIAANFHWSMFSPVFVAPVEGGAYAIIDGQHRTHAAAICGFEQVPCQIVQMTQTEQASAFAAVNGAVTAVTIWQLLKAALAAGEDWAVSASTIAQDGGCRLMTYSASSKAKKPGEIFGVKGFLSVVEARPREAIVTALKALNAAEGYRDMRDIWENSNFVPLVMGLSERPIAVARADFPEALSGLDYMELVERDHQWRRASMRAGGKPEPKSETVRMKVVEWIDKTFPARVALPPPTTKAEIMERIGSLGAG